MQRRSLTGRLRLQTVMERDGGGGPLRGVQTLGREMAGCFMERPLDRISDLG